MAATIKGMPMNKLLALVTALLAVIIAVSGASGQGRIIEMGITSPEMASYFQQHAGSQDIARVDHPNDIGLISGLTVGKKMVIFKSVSQISQFLASNANALDIVGYNLEPGQTHDANELANPVAAAQSVKAVAQRYGKLVAIGLTHDLTLRYGPAMAPYADLWVLQIQKAQNDPAMAGEFVSQMVPALTKANPAIKVFVQIRTDSQPAALAKLVNGLGPVNVSILTQRSDVQDAINVASQFFGQGGSQAQPIGDYGQRLQGANGWLLPVPTIILGSDEEKHLGRGSVNAWDLVAPKGSAIYAMTSGVVEYAGCNNAGGYGCWVLLKHADGYTSSYGHMIEGSIRVSAGQPVTADTLLGQVGWTGKTSFGPHTHFEIRKGGQFLRIDQFFNIGMMKQCNLCSVQGQPVVAQGVTTGQRTQQTVSSPYNRLIEFLRRVNPNLVSLVVVGVFGLLCLIWWLGGLYERVFVVAFATSAVVVGVVLWFVLPMLQPTAGQPAPTVAGTDTWKTAYAFMRKWEGGPNPPCVHDPIRTLKGVTNITYNAWRQSKGLGPGDVCRDLTDSQAQQIYYERYWLASGADKLSPATAIAVFDHAVNAGVGAAKGILAQCGDNANCVIQARYADYKTKSNCPQYCQAWFNRVNDLVKFLQKGNSQS